MLKYLFQLSILFVHLAKAQTIQQLNDKWSFTGFRTTIFKVKNEKLFVGMLEYTDTLRFNRFINGLPFEQAIFTEAAITQKTDTILIHARLPLIDHDLQLMYVGKDTNNILFTGDVFFDSTRLITPNRNCDMISPGCINRLYSMNDLQTMMKLKNHQQFSRDDAFEFLLKLNENLKLRCNKCYAGFTDAYMNEILIDMGFNPIIKLTAANSVWYNTSGFIFYIKKKFSNDARIIKLTDNIFDWYLNQ